jgi:hypothetical protein
MGFASQILIGPDQYLGFQPKPRRLPLTEAQGFFNAGGPFSNRRSDIIDNPGEYIKKVDDTSTGKVKPVNPGTKVERIRNRVQDNPFIGDNGDADVNVQPAVTGNSPEDAGPGPNEGENNTGNNNGNSGNNGGSNNNGNSNTNEPKDVSNYLQYAIPVAAVILAIIAYQYLN